MRRPSSYHWLPLGILLWMAGVMPAWADITLGAKVLSAPGLSMQDVHAHIDDDGHGGLLLDLRAAKADLPAMGWHRIGVIVHGSLHRDARMRWLFDGTAQLAGAPGGALGNASMAMVVDGPANTLQLDLVQGGAQATTALPLDQPSHAQISVKGLPAAWLQGLLAQVGGGHANNGKVDADLALDIAEHGVQASGEFTLGGVDFASPAALLVVQSLNANGRLNLDTSTSPAHLDLDATLHGGFLQAGAVDARLPDHPVLLSLGATADSSMVDLARVHLADTDAMQFDGAVGVSTKGELVKLRIDHLQARFPAAYQRYGQGWLASLGLHDVRTAGQLGGSLDLQPSGLRSFAFASDGLDVADGEGKLGVQGLHGSLDWSSDGERPATTLAWQSLQIYRLDYGAASSHWQSHGGTLGLQHGMDVPLLGGRVHVASLDWHPAASHGPRLTGALTASDVDFAAFSRVMSWVELPGSLSANVPALRWDNDRIEFDGGVSINAFGGVVALSKLAWQSLFGAHPLMSGDVHLQQLDLSPLTSAFNFGNITGRLDGDINNVQLLDWSPVAFNANLHADGGGKLGQRAVNNLAALGGGSASGFQGAMLRLLKTVSYRRIGLRCVLQDNLCHMGGLDGSADDYTIVDGSGLPHLRVAGRQGSLDWPTLVRRLKATSEGPPEPR